MAACETRDHMASEAKIAPVACADAPLGLEARLQPQ